MSQLKPQAEESLDISSKHEGYALFIKFDQ